MVMTACEAQCSVSTANLSEETMASAISPDTKAPVRPATSFSPDTPDIYATAKLSHAPADTAVKATLHYLEGGDRQVLETAITAEGTRYVAFTFSAPTAGWPAGQYEVRLFLNGKEGKRLPFNVAPPQAAALPVTQPAVQPVAMVEQAAPAPQTPVATKQFRDDTFAFTLQLPETWAYRLTPSKDYLFEGPKGTDAYELSVILQFVLKSKNPGATAATQLAGLLTDLEKAPNASVVARDTGRIGGQPAPFVTVTYNARNSAGAVEGFTHSQYVVDHGAYFYLISYSGPSAIYQKHLAVFQRMLDSYRFTD
jgi:hypothetical protein